MSHLEIEEVRHGGFTQLRGTAVCTIFSISGDSYDPQLEEWTYSSTLLVFIVLLQKGQALWKRTTKKDLKK